MGVTVAFASAHSEVGSWWRGGTGALLSIAVHALVIGLVLVARAPQADQAPKPLSVRVLSAPPQPQQRLPEPDYKPAMSKALLHVPQPELVVAAAPIHAAVAVSSAAPAADPTPPPPAPPRFDADYLNNPAPQYPPLSRRLREEGVVLLRVYVLPSGRPEVVEVKRSSGCRRLDDSALQAVRQWRFVPARRGAQAVAAWVVVPIAFSLAV